MIDTMQLNNLIDELMVGLNNITCDLSNITPILPKDDLNRLKRRVYYAEKRSQVLKYLEYLKEWHNKNQNYNKTYRLMYYHLNKNNQDYKQSINKARIKYYNKNREFLLAKQREYYRIKKPVRKPKNEESISIRKENITLYFN
jgi:hypothetical protein